jgi:hypothetical protein
MMATTTGLDKKRTFAAPALHQQVTPAVAACHPVIGIRSPASSGACHSRAATKLQRPPAPALHCFACHVAPLSLPTHLVRFIRSHIHSVLQLEILLLLRERGGHWSVTELEEELRLTANAVDAHVQDLLGRGLLSYDAKLARYTFAPKDERLRSLVDELWRYDGSMRHMVIDLIFPGDRGPITMDEAGRGEPDG